MFLNESKRYMDYSTLNAKGKFLFWAHFPMALYKFKLYESLWH